ncbi:MAG TPA: DNA polymerase III subunit beta [Sulfuricurvum sp.]|nr:MAG: DNA polymerase III subunit beta [Campylobacterales bacterium 16-40-21]OZA02626.1 MAG: DNA polymerase III subunit beta [Sulfuricurvum sp. 17-40-25]HQS67402.1 DNA polymerase III subunit beta [Sulfuricurvum sp.]HQT36442.1 DNA polymerase III subunit beta [Sulfuricurvum sp.]
MKITIDKSVLENILLHLQPFLEKKDTSQITSHILLSTDGRILNAKATDYEIGLTIQTNALTVIEPGSVTANGKKLLDIIRILKDEEVEIELVKENLHIRQKRSNFKLPTYKSSEFPVFPITDQKPKIEINSQILIESLKKITPATDTNNPKFELNGALIDIKNNQINFVSTDTRRLALVHIESQSDHELSIIVPKKAIIEIQKLFNNNIEIYYDNTHLIIKSEDSLFFTKLINGKFPDYTRIIPKESSRSITLPKATIITAIKQITTISNDLKLTFQNDSILFESLSDDNIEAKTAVEIENGFDSPFILAINSRYILDFLGQISGNEFILEANESNQPFVIKEGNFKTIVMPIVI